MNSIKFYKPTDPYGEFSNFSEHPIAVDGATWPTTEHYFQAQKYLGTKYEMEIRLLKTPMEAKIAGSDRKNPLRKDWELIKDDVMRKAVYAKFTQHKELRDILISTGDSYLIEHTHNDSYWGDEGNGNGRNMLGQILMSVRDQLLSEN